MDDAKTGLGRLGGVIPRRPALRRPSRRARRVGLTAGLALLVGALGGTFALLPSDRPASRRPAQLQVGVASWYGPGFYGRPTASGEVYTGAALTAAHRSLPLGTQVRVTNLDNGRRVVVKVDDRGPYIRGRLIDLSVAAARRLDMIDDGLARVRVEVLRRPERPRA